MTLEQKVGQMFIAGFESPFIDEHVTKIIKECHIGNIIYFSRNLKNPKQLLK